MAGDVPSAKLLYSYTIGKPTPPVDPDTLDVQEWRVFSQQPVRFAELKPLVKDLPAELVCRLLRALMPGISISKAKMLRRMLKLDDVTSTPPAQCAPTPNGGNVGPSGGAGIPASPEADRNVCSTRNDRKRQRKLKKKQFFNGR